MDGFAREPGEHLAKLIFVSRRNGSDSYFGVVRWGYSLLNLGFELRKWNGDRPLRGNYHAYSLHHLTSIPRYRLGWFVAR